MLLNRDSGSKQKMDGSTLIETLFSIKATIGVVIFALVPLLEGITLRTTSEKRATDIKFELYEEMKTLAAFLLRERLSIQYTWVRDTRSRSTPASTLSFK